MIGAMALTVGAAGAYFFVWEPIQANRAKEAALEEEIGKLEQTDREQTAKLKTLTARRVQSLPADQTLAKQEYIVALEHLLEIAIKAAEEAGVPKGDVKYSINAQVVDNSARSNVPEISKGKPVYTRIAYQVSIKKANMWIVQDVLKGYYQMDLLHQITHLSIKKDEENTKGR